MHLGVGAFAMRCSGARKIVWHFDFERVVLADGALGYVCFCEALQRPLCRVNGAKMFVRHFGFGPMVLTGALGYVFFFFLRGVAKTIVPSEWCCEVCVAVDFLVAWS